MDDLGGDRAHHEPGNTSESTRSHDNFPGPDCFGAVHNLFGGIAFLSTAGELHARRAQQLLRRLENLAIMLRCHFSCFLVAHVDLDFAVHA